MDIQQLQKYLNDNDLYWSGLSESDDTFIITIEWGDWEHDHLYLQHLMGKVNLPLKSYIITEENGSDCYSAEYEFFKNSL